MVEIHRRAGEEGHALLWEPDVAQIYSGTPVNTYDFAAMKKADKVLRNLNSQYEEAIVKISGTDLYTVVSRLGSRMLKAGQYAGAVEAFNSIPKIKHRPIHYSEDIKAGPFQNPFSESFHSGEKAKDYTPHTIASRMLELKGIAEKSSGDRAAEAYYRMGLAQFNMSHFGHWWSAVDTDWSIYYDYSDKKGDPQLALATDYFQKSLSKGSDRELIAASRFMIATIAYLDHASVDYSSDGLVSLAPEQKVQFSKLAELEDTQFYREVIRSCTYYMNFRN
tara:strand:- start:79 stop:912 length:834 start_codon:yes stop_codon:yes gene_type:complete